MRRLYKYDTDPTIPRYLSEFVERFFMANPIDQDPVGSDLLSLLPQLHRQPAWTSFVLNEARGVFLEDRSRCFWDGIDLHQVGEDGARVELGVAKFVFQNARRFRLPAADFTDYTQ